MIAATAALAFVLACVSYYQIKFHVENGSLIYRHNLISRASTTIPLDRIHTLRTRQGLLYRLLNLRGVLFDTLASKGEEIELILSEADWQCLLDEVEIQEKPQPLAPDIPLYTVPLRLLTSVTRTSCSMLYAGITERYGGPRRFPRCRFQLTLRPAR